MSKDSLSRVSMEKASQSSQPRQVEPCPIWSMEGGAARWDSFTPLPLANFSRL
jgi:hypothetical protein